MTRQNRFVIHNDLSKTLLLNIEPEGAFFPLQAGEEVAVKEAFSSIPLTLKVAGTSEGEVVVSIWPGDGEVCVQQGGFDVLDLLQEEAKRESELLTKNY